MYERCAIWRLAKMQPEGGFQGPRGSTVGKHGIGHQCNSILPGGEKWMSSLVRVSTGGLVRVMGSFTKQYSDYGVSGGTPPLGAFWTYLQSSNGGQTPILPSPSPSPPSPPSGVTREGGGWDITWQSEISDKTRLGSAVNGFEIDVQFQNGKKTYHFQSWQAIQLSMDLQRFLVHWPAPDSSRIQTWG
ncbi:hypothetical protein LX32DRAFT_163600 [Colletotrichum zoysiae]|uniref:Uncharacterized protein n=1 Tax=Colletotrichum zoysiae TaxID=1216348 RepID=A0AAD9H6G2_9PEZI|nr:hypothetical protein LX32DRAFT_163600 [Colletotrichum zoysiae]